ncbi:hypothetical protein MEO41_29295, partial [Dolichospermum sp. ST_sed4]|nr:hypothetical protein [Dolichospermum sp. ST_sed4]
KTDLDFGIYRILNLRSRDVERFIAEILPQKLEAVKAKLVQRATIEIKDDLDVIKTELKTSYGEDFDTKVEQFGQIAAFKE